ncbi:MAG: hypothetical protein WAU91_20285, partial [Desulfatitalea sp.]
QARAFFPARQELAVAQTACRSYKNALAWTALHMALAETMIKAEMTKPKLTPSCPHGECPLSFQFLTSRAAFLTSARPAGVKAKALLPSENPSYLHHNYNRLLFLQFKTTEIRHAIC